MHITVDLETSFRKLVISWNLKRWLITEVMIIMKLKLPLFQSHYVLLAIFDPLNGPCIFAIIVILQLTKLRFRES